MKRRKEIISMHRRRITDAFVSRTGYDRNRWMQAALMTVSALICLAFTAYNAVRIWYMMKGA